MDWMSEDALGCLSAGLSRSRSLCKLRIIGAELDDLPPGPYLHGLESLCMDYCTLKSGVPAGMAAATQLRSLDLGRLTIGVLLTAAEVAVLSSIPALVTLTLRKEQCVS